MKFNGTLFERLSEKKTELNDRDALIHSIAANIALILSTNAGNSESASDYGKPDINNTDMCLFDTMRSMESSIQRAICSFEPRILNTKTILLKEKETPFDLKFSICGSANYKSKTIPVHYIVTVSGCGQVEVFHHDS